MTKTLEEIIEKYQDTRENYRYFIREQEITRDTLIEYESRFVDLRADLRDHRSSILKEWIRRDDKAATAIKFRIAMAIHRGEFEDYEECSITQAEKLASGTKKYKDFVDQRSFYKESFTNVTDLREDIGMYINEIKDRLKS